MPRQKLTPAFILKAALPEKGDRIIYWEGSFGLQVTAGGHRSFVVQYRANGKSRRMSLKAGLGLAGARREAKAILGDVARGGDPVGDKKRKAARVASHTLRAIAEEYLARDGKRLRSIDQRRRVFNRCVYPDLGDREISDIKRSEIVRMLDHIEDENGPRMAHVVLAYMSRLFNWHASRNDDFRSPVIRGMGRVNAKERARTRILSDDELRAIWRATETAAGPFAAYVRFLLLTGARRTEGRLMTRAELSGRDWLLPAARNKVKVDFLRPLSNAAMDVLAGLPPIGRPDGFVFTVNGRCAFGNQWRLACDLQERSGTSGWTLHDLRRTARSLMSRAGVPADHAEICMGHILPGVRGIYDRHQYYDEKLLAFEKLASLIERIVNPQANVVPLRQEALA